MSLLPGIGLYNSSRLPDAAFIDAFVARHDELERLTDSLQEQVSGAAPEHHIIIGSRGMGKSTLLRRLSLAIRDSTALAGGLVPLSFREEQYNVLTLAQFWRNCGESLADWCEQNDRKSLAQDLDRAMAGPNWRDGIAAGEEFLATCQLLGRRAVLLIDNLDLILDALKDQEPWQLRNVLQRRDGPIVVGAATQFLSQASDREAAFYEFFHPLVLEPLSEADLFACLRALAELRGEAGAPVLRIIAQDSPRLRTLYSLTGGNPRVLALLYQVLERSESADVFGDLESLLDQVSPYYKARVEEYATAQQRAVIDAMALHWDPITSHDLSQETGIPVTTLSGHLLRLKRDGFAEEVTLSGARAGYQLAERFFNIWYLMRHGTRRTRQRLRWLAIFLTRLFSPEDLARMADIARRQDGTCSWSHDHREAVIAAHEEMQQAHRAKSLQTSLPESAETDTQEAAALLARGNSEFHAGSLIDALEQYEVVISRYGNTRNPELQEKVASALVCKGFTLSQLGQQEDAIVTFQSIIDRYGRDRKPHLQKEAAIALLSKGLVLGQLGRLEEAIPTFQAIVELYDNCDNLIPQELVATALASKGLALRQLGRLEDAILAYQSVAERYGDEDSPTLKEQVAKALFNKGVALRQLGRLEDAILSYEFVVERYGNDTSSAQQEIVACALVNKGGHLGQLGRLEEAILAYQSVVERYGDDARPVLQEQVAKALVNKANLLWDDYGQTEAAEALYHQALAIQLDELSTQTNLAWLWIVSGHPAQAVAARERLVALPAHGLALLDAGLAIASDNFGAMTEHLAAALDSDLNAGVLVFFDDLLRLLRLVEAKGYGEKLIAWFSESGMADRYAPVHAAFIAYCRGERFLLDVNPEVRAPARTLYDRLSAPRRHQEAPPPPKKKRGRPRKG